MNKAQAAHLPVYLGHDLGAVWQTDATAFRLWAPTASKVTLHRYATGTDAEPGAADLGRTELRRDGGGTWLVRLSGDLSGQYYQYELQFPDGAADAVADPYARAAGANGARSMVIDLDAAAPDGWRQDARPHIPPHARSVWEVHVGDFTADPACGVPAAWRGKFLGFTADGATLNGDGLHPTALNYLKRLGVSHVQLQPIFDFATVDEVTGQGYNWGYDPLNYNVPEGSYATDAFRGEVRVRECRAMIAALHRAGLGVVMDVVFNHTYNARCWLERTVPGYWLRRWDNGKLTDGSGCGNDLASERAMVRKYIVDSCVYWAKEYHIDGFRFDLMAVHDVDTMNAVRAALDALPGGKDILMYGEPWQGGKTRMEGDAVPANKQAAALNERIGFFCDDTRDAVKGDVFLAEHPGYVNGKPDCGYRLLPALSAWRGGQAGYTPNASGQVVQYVSAHDNYTLWDKLKLAAKRRDFDVLDAELLAQNRMAAGIYLTCQGLPFMQAGEEFARTKQGQPNTYRGPAALNALDWARAAALDDLVRYYRGLLDIRKAYPELSGAEGDAEPCILSLPGWLIGFVPERRGERLPGRLAVYYNPERTPQQAALPAGVWRTLCDGARATAAPFGPVRRGQIALAPVSVTILRAV